MFQQSRCYYARDCLLVLVCLSAIFCCSGGCGTGSAQLSRRTVAISEIPEDVLGAAKTQLPDVEFADAWKNLDKEGKLHSYEIRGRNKNGKIREVRVSPTGEILEVE